MTDRAAVAVAIAAVAGALEGWGSSLWVGASCVVIALVVRRPVVLAIGVFVVAGSLAARAEAGLVPPQPAPFDDWATLLTDPDTGGFGLVADVRVEVAATCKPQRDPARRSAHSETCMPASASTSSAGSSARHPALRGSRPDMS